MGRLGADPLSRQTKNGTSVVQLSVATTRKTYRENPDPALQPILSEETQWHQVTVWGRQGDHCSQYLKKGSPVYVEGFLRSRTFENKDKISVTRFEVQAETVSFLSKAQTGIQRTEAGMETTLVVEPTASLNAHAE